MESTRVVLILAFLAATLAAEVVTDDDIGKDFSDGLEKDFSQELDKDFSDELDKDFGDESEKDFSDEMASSQDLMDNEEQFANSEFDVKVYDDDTEISLDETNSNFTSVNITRDFEETSLDERSFNYTSVNITRDNENHARRTIMCSRRFYSVFTPPSHVTYSPGYPRYYPRNYFCGTRFYTYYYRRIRACCSYYIRSGDYFFLQTRTRLYRYAGSRSVCFRIYSNYVTIGLRTNSAFYSRGFRCYVTYF